MRIVNIANGRVLAWEARLANRFFSRLIGLLGTNHLLPGSGLVIKPCSGVHTFGMKYSIDVVFTDNKGRIVKIVHDLAPGRIASCREAVCGVELPVGTAVREEVEVGDILEYQHG